MKLVEKIQQIERVDALIKRKATGSPKELAARLGTSERSIYKLIQLMKKLKAPIYFDQDYNSYCYKEEVIFSIGFQQKRKQIKGGYFHFLCHCTISAVRSIKFATETFHKGFSKPFKRGVHILIILP